MFPQSKQHCQKKIESLTESQHQKFYYFLLIHHQRIVEKAIDLFDFLGIGEWLLYTEPYQPVLL